MSILDIKNVSKSYDKNLVLNDISITVPEKSIYGLLGPNGAGKTTLIRIVNQIIMPNSGEVFFNGEKLNRKHISVIGYLPEERGLYNKMMVGEQMIYLARLKGFAGSQARSEIRRILEEFEVLSWWNKKVETLSKGMQQKLQFIVAIMHNPILAILDEPFSGFDPINVEIVKKKILQLRKNGTSFILSTHRMESVEELCDHITLINKSNKVIEGNIAQIKSQFKKNIYEITYKGERNENIFSNDPNFHVFSLEDLPEQGLHQLKISMQKNIGINQMLEKLMSVSEIVSLSEIIPSINEFDLA